MLKTLINKYNICKISFLSQVTLEKKHLHLKYAFDINKYFIFRKWNEIPNYDRRERGSNIVKKSKLASNKL